MLSRLYPCLPRRGHCSPLFSLAQPPHFLQKTEICFHSTKSPIGLLMLFLDSASRSACLIKTLNFLKAGMVLSFDLGLQWRWAHCKLAKHWQDFLLTSLVPLPLGISQRFLTHMQLPCFLRQVSNFLFSLLGIFPLCLKSLPLLAYPSQAPTNYVVYQEQGKGPSLSILTSLTRIRNRTRASVVCWESQSGAEKQTFMVTQVSTESTRSHLGGWSSPILLSLCVPWAFPCFTV